MTKARFWQHAKRVLLIVFFALTIGALVHVARSVEWAEVLRAVAATPPLWLLGAGAAAFGSYAVYCTFDVLGRYYTGHSLPVRQIVPVTFVCYAFNLSLGAWLGSIGLRYRLYSRLGLPTGTISRVLSFSLLTNWIGHGALAGVLFASGAARPPEGFALGGRALGIGWLLLVGAYFAACAFSTKRTFVVRGHQIELPSARLAFLQLGLGAGNWALQGLSVFILLGGQVAYAQVLGTLLVSAIAGVAAHIPAGLGVVEAVFVATLSPALPRTVVLGALLCHRALYFLLPLAIAAVIYFFLEAKTAQPTDQKRHFRRAEEHGSRG